MRAPPASASTFAAVVPSIRSSSPLAPLISPMNRLRDAIEIVVVAYGVYRLLLLLHGTRAVQMLIGIVVLVLTYALAWVFKFTMITYLLGIVFTYGAFAALVIFQPELRAALAHLGQSRVTRFCRRTGVS